MLKILGRFTLLDYFFVFVLVAFVYFQAFFDVEIPTVTSRMMDEIMLPTATTSSILRIGLDMLLMSLGSLACSFGAGFIAAFLSSKLARTVRKDVFDKVQSFSFEEINRFSGASLITRSTNDIQQVQFAVMMILRMAIFAPIIAFLAIRKISVVSFELTLTTSIVIFLLVAFLIVVFVLAIPRFKILQALTDRLNGVTRENLTGLKVVKAYNADKLEEQKFDNVNNDVLKTNLFVNRIMGLMHPMMLFFMNALTLCVYWIGANLVQRGELNVSDMIAFSMLVMQILMAFMMLTMLFVMVPRAAVSAKRINEVLDTRLTILDSKDSVEINKIESVEFKNVGFKYPNAEDYVLKNISFTASSGDVIAVIGSTGSGKSTLINLIPRFYDSTDGEILIDGVDIKTVKQASLRSKIGYVPQKGVLFSGTVKENIAYAIDSLEDEKIIEAAKIACAHEFVSEMPDKYDSYISQGGKNVSGGQRQRLSIARAVALSPDVFIFDDSFSALDFKTDRTVRENLSLSMGEAISFIVAQRIGTILNADKIIVLDNGKMVGIGKHDELLESCEVYREIALSQLSEAELNI